MSYDDRNSKHFIKSRFGRRGIYWLPNMFTLAALFSGFYAIVQAMNERFELAALAIFAAMVLDGLDGRIARWRQKSSALGQELDSLADVISFGVAPAAIAFAAGIDSAFDQACSAASGCLSARYASPR